MSERHPEIVLSGQEAKTELRRRTRRDFLIGGLAAAAAIGGYEWVTSAARDNGAPWPQRRVLDFNGKLSHAYLSDAHLMPTYSRDQVGWLKPNGDIGMDEAANAPSNGNDWRLQVEAGGPALNLTLADVMALPKIEMIMRFCCIEGWSTIAYWGGARFSDFTRKYFRPGADLPNYVYMATPGEEYYVGLDMKSAMHPQTLLAYEQNGKLLENEHGAPLRLVIPVKYGIKNIKRIALIRYTNARPDDYWAEEGYDWFAGL
jgi:DMSO/TMAO reductase YedYZ molybdopterin-dependent catalytic subunit